MWACHFGLFARESLIFAQGGWHASTKHLVPSREPGIRKHCQGQWTVFQSVFADSFHSELWRALSIGTASK